MTLRVSKESTLQGVYRLLAGTLPGDSRLLTADCGQCLELKLTSLDFKLLDVLSLSCSYIGRGAAGGLHEPSVPGRFLDLP